MTRDDFISMVEALGSAVDLARYLEHQDELFSHDAKQRTLIEQQAKEIAKMQAVLREILMGKGAFSENQLEHATNTIEDMKRLARQALTPTEEI